MLYRMRVKSITVLEVLDKTRIVDKEWIVAIINRVKKFLLIQPVLATRLLHSHVYRHKANGTSNIRNISGFVKHIPLNKIHVFLVITVENMR